MRLGVWRRETKTVKLARADKAATELKRCQKLGRGNDIHLEAKRVMVFPKTTQRNKKTEVEKQIFK